LIEIISFKTAIKSTKTSKKSYEVLKLYVIFMTLLISTLMVSL